MWDIRCSVVDGDDPVPEKLRQSPKLDWMPVHQMGVEDPCAWRRSARTFCGRGTRCIGAMQTYPFLVEYSSALCTQLIRCCSVLPVWEERCIGIGMIKTPNWEERCIGIGMIKTPIFFSLNVVQSQMLIHLNARPHTLSIWAHSRY